MAFLLDTNVVSELRKPIPAGQVTQFIDAYAKETLFLSAVSIVEIRYGLQVEPNEIKRADIQRWFDTVVKPLFEERILQVSEDILLRWKLLLQAGQKAGKTYSPPDALIAATALEHDLTLVTRNVKDFENSGVRFFNPWL